MEIKPLIIVNNKNKEEFVFDKSIVDIDNPLLLKELGKENYKNEDSSLSIKLDGETTISISDVIQLKINVKSTGVFLVSFAKEALSEETRKELIDKISTLKDDNKNPDQESQSKKISSLLDILNEYSPLYVTLSNTGYIKVDIHSIIQDKEQGYPLLNLVVIKKEQPRYFKADYWFIFIFSLYITANTIAAVHELINTHVGIGIALLACTLVAVILNTYACYQEQYKGNRKNDKSIKFITLVYIVIGLVIGSIIGVLLSKYLLTKEEDVFDIARLMLLGTLPSNILGILSWALMFPIRKILTREKKQE